MSDPIEAGPSLPPEANWFERVSGWAVHLAAIVMQVAMVGIVVNALMRYGFGAGFAIISETTRFVLLLVVFLGLAGTHLAGGHVRVQLLTDVLPGRIRSVLFGYVVPAASIFYLGLLTYSGALTALRLFERGATTPSRPAIPLAPFMALVPAGCILLILVLVVQLVRRIRRGPQGEDAGGRPRSEV